MVKTILQMPQSLAGNEQLQVTLQSLLGDDFEIEYFSQEPNFLHIYQQNIRRITESFELAYQHHFVPLRTFAEKAKKYTSLMIHSYLDWCRQRCCLEPNLTPDQYQEILSHYSILLTKLVAHLWGGTSTEAIEILDHAEQELIHEKQHPLVSVLYAPSPEDPNNLVLLVDKRRSLAPSVAQEASNELTISHASALNQPQMVRINAKTGEIIIDAVALKPSENNTLAQYKRLVANNHVKKSVPLLKEGGLPKFPYSAYGIMGALQLSDHNQHQLLTVLKEITVDHINGWQGTHHTSPCKSSFFSLFSPLIGEEDTSPSTKIPEGIAQLHDILNRPSEVSLSSTARTALLAEVYTVIVSRTAAFVGGRRDPITQKFYDTLNTIIDACFSDEPADKLFEEVVLPELLELKQEIEVRAISNPHMNMSLK